ncbi:hypothetical protein PMIN04_000504 [Paraphaeosphaeria minitans]
MPPPKNPYTTLGLPTPHPPALPGPDVLRKAYKTALLAAHPDKIATAGGAAAAVGISVDDVKEALAVFSDPGWRGVVGRLLEGEGDGEGDGEGVRQGGADFVLGLEVLDLAEFEVGGLPFVRLGSPEGEGEDVLVGEGSGGDEQAQAQAQAQAHAEAEMEWTRPCRCGADKGFRIRERELVDAEGRGERDVLVGCEGCSLWVRVEFDVEEG